MTRFSTLPLILILCIALTSCMGGDGEIDIDDGRLPLQSAKRIAIVPFFAETGATADVSKLGGRISVNLATRLELLFKEVDWIYDISTQVKPVADTLTTLGLTREQIYADAALAAKLGQALNADMVILGKVETPKLTRRDDDRHLMKQGRQGGISGTSTYIRTLLTAIGRTRVKVIATDSSEILFNTRIRSYLKYWYAYQTQQSEQQIFKSDTERLADLGKYLPLRIAARLHPTGLQAEPEERILLKPDIILKGTGGVVAFN